MFLYSEVMTSSKDIKNNQQCNEKHKKWRKKQEEEWIKNHEVVLILQEIKKSETQKKYWIKKKKKIICVFWISENFSSQSREKQNTKKITCRESLPETSANYLITNTNKGSSLLSRYLSLGRKSAKFTPWRTR